MKYLSKVLIQLCWKLIFILSFSITLKATVVSTSMMMDAFVFTIPQSKINELVNFHSGGGGSLFISLYNGYGKPHDLVLTRKLISIPSVYTRYSKNLIFEFVAVDDNRIYGVISLSNGKIKASIFEYGKLSIIEPTNQTDTYISTIVDAEQYVEDVQNMIGGHIETQLERKEASKNRSSTVLTRKLYRIAILATGEFSNSRGNDLKQINADIDFFVASLNIFFDRELLVNFIRVSGDALIFLNPTTDGIENGFIGDVHDVIDSTMGAANYDVGHGVDHVASGGYGGAVYQSARNNNSLKAAAISSATTNGALLSILFHEVGHQFGANHIFYGTSNQCLPNRRAGSGFEPGSGSSLMGYSGACGVAGSCNTSQNVLPSSSSFYFNTANLDQMKSYIAQVGAFQEEVITPNNIAFTLPSNKFIPKGTPFQLIGNSNQVPSLVSYNWEQVDTDSLLLNCPNGSIEEGAMSLTAPLFRSVVPSSQGNTRTFPEMLSIINNTSNSGEVLPQITRDINLRLTARIEGFAAKGENIKLTVSGNSGPFALTSQNVNATIQANTNLNVTWSVNNTNQAPVNCGMVSIYLSLDGGLTFPITLVENTANDGAQTVMIPNVSTSQARIMVRAVGNYFFDINNHNFTIVNPCLPKSFAFVLDSTIVYQKSCKNPPLSPIMLSSADTLQSAISPMSPISPNPMRDLANQNYCINGLQGNYATINIYPKVSGYYYFSSLVDPVAYKVSISTNDFSNTSPCSSFLASNGFFLSSSSTEFFYSPDNMFAYLLKDMKYTMRVAGPIGSFNIAYTGPTTLDEQLSPDPNLQYVFVNSANTIRLVSSSPDLESLAPGNYQLFAVRTKVPYSFSSYVNQSFSFLNSQILNGSICAKISSNAKLLNVLPYTPKTIQVTSASNDGPNTLRQRVKDACEGDNIVFSISDTIIKLNTSIQIDKSLVIAGSSLPTLSLEGLGNSVIFEVFQNKTMNLKSFKLKHNATQGAIINNGNLVLENIIVSPAVIGSGIKPFSNAGNITFKGNSKIMK